MQQITRHAPYFHWGIVAKDVLDCTVGAKRYIVEYPPSPKFGRTNWRLCLMPRPSDEAPARLGDIKESLEAV